MNDPIRHAAAALAVLALAAAPLGCGGSDGEPAPAPGGDQATPAPGQGGQDAGAGTGGADGQGLFASRCGSCHVLAAAGTKGSVGPNLDDLRPDRERVLTAIEEGPGVMPENLYQGAEAEAVADYVAENAGS